MHTSSPPFPVTDIAFPKDAKLNPKPLLEFLAVRLVQGDAATLADAILDDGWPTIEATRQHLVVVVNDTSALRTEYRAVADPACFVFAEPGDPDAAFVKADNPRADPARLASDP